MINQTIQTKIVLTTKNKFMEKRIIKFRAFDKSNNKMYSPMGSLFLRWDSNNGTDLVNELASDEGCCDCSESEDEVVVMQFTGLLDRNGKEIYEGDIIKGGSRIMNVTYKQQACQFWMVWEDKVNVSRYEPLTANFSDGTSYSNDSIEVIGNILEHEHLITK